MLLANFTRHEESLAKQEARYYEFLQSGNFGWLMEQLGY